VARPGVEPARSIARRKGGGRVPGTAQPGQGVRAGGVPQVRAVEAIDRVK
jgi:hypothetical protein